MLAKSVQHPRRIGLVAGDFAVFGDFQLLDQRPEEPVRLGDLDQTLQRGGVLPDSGQHLLIGRHALLTRVHNHKGRRRIAHRNQPQDDQTKHE
ncbi:hypothetical protein [Rhodopseudomonas parapalustris]